MNQDHFNPSDARKTVIGLGEPIVAETDELTRVMHERQQTLTVYCCGGAGINIGRQAVKLSKRSRNNPRFAKLHTVYVDTGKGNVYDTDEQENFYIMEGTVGSGGLRGEHADDITANVKPLLNRHPAQSDTVVIISSGGGGSGATWAASLARELQSQGKMVIAFLIGSTMTRHWAENTLKAVETYRRLVKRSGVPIALRYLENNELVNRKTNDDAVNADLSSLLALFSGNNLELDPQDLAHWINFPKISDFEPSLVELTLFGEEGTRVADLPVVSLATLTTPEKSQALQGADVDNQCVGFYDARDGADLFPLHFALIQHGFTDLITHLDTVVAKTQDKNESRTRVQEVKMKSRVKLDEDDDILL